MEKKTGANGSNVSLWCICAGAAWLMGLTADASAQVVLGRVLDADTDVLIEGAQLALIDSTQQPVARVFSDTQGRFELRAPQPGRYELRVERIGYQRTASAPIELAHGDIVRVEMRISAHPVPLPPLTVLSRRGRRDSRLENWGYYRRQSQYEGLHRATFITREDFDSLGASKVTDLVRDLPNFRLVRVGHQVLVETRKGQPVPVFLDGHDLRLRREQSIDELVALGSVKAVEIYWRWAPAQYGGGAAIVLWTGP